jgi:DNA polymerase-3 subunit gamma/tau
VPFIVFLDGNWEWQMTQALYNKWRPQKWDEIVGQQHVVQTLRNAIIGDRVVHAYLFAGPRGTGKTTAARLLAKAVNCQNEDPAARPCNSCSNCVAVNESRYLDLIEIDAASNSSVEDVRDLRDKINFIPNQGTHKVYIIDEVHMLSKEAFNALLKTLEEPPAHAIFILATTEMHRIPATVVSRCQRYEFRRIPVNEIVGQLQKIATREKLVIEPEALALISRQSMGGMRDAISLLDQMASMGKAITLDLTQNVLGTATNQTVIDLVDAILKQESAAGMNSIHTALDSGTDPRLLARQVVDYLRGLLLVQMGNAGQVDLGADTLLQAERHAGSFATSEVLRMIKSFNLAATDLRGGWQPSLPLELALAEALEEPKVINLRPTPDSGTKTNTTRKEEIPERKHSNQKETVGSAPESKPPSPSPVTLGQVSNAWKQVKEALRSQQPSLAALLNSCRLMEIKDGVLVLGFASEVLRSKMEVPAQIELTRKVINEAVGVDLGLRCVITNAKQSPPPDVKADGMVAAAIKHGGEIVDIQE